MQNSDIYNDRTVQDFICIISRILAQESQVIKL